MAARDLLKLLKVDRNKLGFLVSGSRAVMAAAWRRQDIMPYTSALSTHARSRSKRSNGTGVRLDRRGGARGFIILPLDHFHA